MSIGVIIPWCNRAELSRTLMEHQSLFAMYADSIVIANCGGNRVDLWNLLPSSSTPNLQVIEIDARAFNKSLALNIGASALECESLLLLDADVILNADFIIESEEALNRSAACVLGEIRESDQQFASTAECSNFEIDHSLTVRVEDRVASLITNRFSPRRGSRSAIGNVLLRRELFIAIGGLNSGLTQWGWEDADMLIRAQLHSGQPLSYVGSGIHLTHGDEVRNLAGGTREESESRNYLRCVSEYIAGRFIGTYEADVSEASYKKLDIEPS